MNRTLSDLLYAPIGLVADASRVVPELAEQGRMQVNNARVMGEMATRMGSAKLAEQLTGLGAHLHGFLARAGLVPPEVDEPAEATVTGGAAATTAAPRVPARPEPAPAAQTPAEPSTPAAGDLAIVDYDSLAASQVVPRLAALKPEELEAVRLYELGNRGRKTILGRVAQLQG